MSEPHNGDHGDESLIPHLPDPSPWPIIAGIAVLLLGAALVWWVADDDSDFTGPFLGAAVAVTLVSIAGWAYEDGRMRKAAEEHAGHPQGAARYTQVMTFAIPEGQLEQARAGVLSAVEDSDSTLHNLAGFQDLRIGVSPAGAGPSQVLVETTWSGRDSLATYEETRQTLLDLLQGYPEQVATGSVQVFDMEVVRDTKDVSMRLGMGAAATLLGAFLIGGVALGAGLSFFEEEDAVSENGGGGETPGPGGFDGTIVATADNKFSVDSITLPPNTEVTLTLDNQGGTHNIAFFQSPTPGEGALLTGCTAGCEGGDVTTPLEAAPVQQTFTFTTPAVGEYSFHCDAHPDQMTGSLIIEEGAPLPGQAPGPGAPPAAGIQVTATDNAFDVDTIEAAAGSEVSVTLTNEGQVPHNIHFYTEEGGETLAEGADGEILDGGASETLTFTAPEPGTYYFQCDLHPTEMTGDFVVS